MKLNIRILLYILGLLLCFESLFLLLSFGVSLLYQENDRIPLLFSTIITACVGFLLAICSRKHERKMGKREVFLLVSFSWIIFSLFGMLPFLLGGYLTSVADAFFETMSGFTTTGATVIDHIDDLPHGILFWRSITQWLGGMGIIVLTLAILPMLNSGEGTQLFNAEAPGVRHDKITPRISQTAKRLWVLYLSMTLVASTILYLGPMNLFDSICHAFSAMATGGYSTKQASIAYWESPYTEYAITLIMFFAGINFSLLYITITGNYKKLFKDQEVKWYACTVLIFTLTISIGLLYTGQYHHVEEAFRVSIFQVVSLITTTGFATADFVVWGPFFCFLMFLIMIPGACAGSTSGGLKQVRIIIAFKHLAIEFYKQLHPRAVVPVRINKYTLPPEMVTKVLSFILIYALVALGCSAILSMEGFNFEESISVTITCLSNVGPGLGSAGPSGTLAYLSDISKWTLSFAMLVGRLELFTVLILFTPYFWKK